MKLFTLAFLLLFLTNFCKSQTNHTYSPVKDDSLQKNQTFQLIKKRFLNDSLSLSGDYKKDYLEIYSQRFQSIKSRFETREIVFEKESTTYFNSILEEIFRNNPNLKALEPRILVSRNSWPNAYSLGEGTIIVNAGLFQYLENESQLAFVLCHELAHLYLKHSAKHIDQYITTINSKEYQQKLRQIKRSDYQKNNQAEMLAKNIAFTGRRHSREDESAADAQALEFMLKTKFDVLQIIRSLEILDTIDDEDAQMSSLIEKHFNFEAFPFQARWIKKETALFSNTQQDSKEAKERDSLKTHPDCIKRIDQIQVKLKGIQTNGKMLFLTNETIFNKLRNQLRFESIQFCFNINEISKSLFLALKLSHEFPENTYLHSIIGNCLHLIYISQKNHELNKIVDLPGPGFSEHYNEVLRFIQNTRLTELAAVNYYYLLQFQESDKLDEDFMNALINSKSNYNKPEEKNQWIQFYKANFINHRYQF